MFDWTTLGTVPTNFTLPLRDRQVIDRGISAAHQTIALELPIFVSVRAKPISRIVMPFVREAHRNAVSFERPEFLDQAVLEFLVPFPCEKLDDGRATFDELRPV